MAELSSTALLSDANLKAYWKLEDYTDSSGNGKTLTAIGTPSFSTAKYGNGLDMGTSNASNGATLNENLGIAGNACTISFWVKLRGEIGSGEWRFVEQSDAGTHVRQEVRYQYNGGTRRLIFTRSKMNIANEDLNYNITLGTTDFYHVVYTYDNTNIEGYVNGVSVGTQAASGNGATVGYDVIQIGYGDNGTIAVDHSSTILDDIAIFNRALTAAEVLTLYQESPQGGFIYMST